MRTFEHYPENSKCPICGTSDNKECVLVPIDGTDDEYNSEAIPTHVECILKMARYSPDAKVIYARAKMSMEHGS